MLEKFKQKYAIKSARLENYNYSQNGLYFVTICTKDREELFGEIISGEVILSDVGKIVQEELLKTPIIRPNIFLDAWVIMPNHLHVIIEIINPIPSVETPRWGVSKTIDINALQSEEKILSKTTMEIIVNSQVSEMKENMEVIVCSKTPQRGVSTGKYGGRNPNWKPNSLGSTINQFKAACTKKIWKSGSITFAWQPRFYDHIIRNDESLNKIREYIIRNPEMWELDLNNVENVFM